MTVCVAAVSGDGDCIVCIADKALSYGDYIQWDSDCIKIANLRGQAVMMCSSDKESHLTSLFRKLAEISEYRLNRYELAKFVEIKFRSAFEEMQVAEILVPEMLSKERYLDALVGDTINEHVREIARKMQRLVCCATPLICGYDDVNEPYILHITSPGIVTDYTNVGFHAVGTGAEKAVAQLLFDEHKRTSAIPRTLYECFDAKAHAEMAVGVGYEWDACFVREDGAHVVSKETTLFRRRSCEKVAPAGQFEAGGRVPVTCPP